MPTASLTDVAEGNSMGSVRALGRFEEHLPHKRWIYFYFRAGRGACHPARDQDNQ